jgi:hypothetical protein
MKKTFLAMLLLAVLGLVTLSACGGGGGGGGAPQASSTPAVLTLSTAATSSIPATTTINSYDVTIPLPAGVTVKTLPNSSETSAGVVTASGNAAGATVVGTYTAASGPNPGLVKVFIVKVNIDQTGFNPGEFCKVNVDIAAGNSYTPSSFAAPTLDDVTGFDTLTTSTVTTVLQGQLSLSSAVVIN